MPSQSPRTPPRAPAVDRDRHLGNPVRGTWRHPPAIGAAMRLVVRFLGLDVLDLSLSTDGNTEAELDEYDPATVLSGGNLGAYPIDAGPTDRYMGFTSGLEADE